MIKLSILFVIDTSSINILSDVSTRFYGYYLDLKLDLLNGLIFFLLNDILLLHINTLINVNWHRWRVLFYFIAI